MLFRSSSKQGSVQRCILSSLCECSTRGCPSFPDFAAAVFCFSRGKANWTPRDSEAIAPHQSTLLRVFDSYLHAAKHGHEVASSRKPDANGESLLDMLCHTFLNLAVYAQAAIRRALESPRTTSTASNSLPHTHVGDTRRRPDCSVGASIVDVRPVDAVAPLQSLDLLLPKVCEALVLATTALTTIALRDSESETEGPVRATPASDAEHRTGPKTSISTTTSPNGQGFIECLIGACSPSLSSFHRDPTHQHWTARTVRPRHAVCLVRSPITCRHPTSRGRIRAPYYLRQDSRASRSSRPV